MIIVGVLIAFQVENWREERASLEREQAQLEALTADFEENAERLDDAMSFQGRTLRAHGRIFEIATGGDPMPPPDSAQDLFRLSRQFARFEPVTGAYDAMVSSGDLRLLRSGELRAELAAFVGAVGTGYEDAALGDLLRSQLMRRAAEIVPLARLIPPGVARATSFSGGGQGADLTALFQDQVFVGLLVELGGIEGRTQLYFGDLADRTNRILELLGEQ